MKKLKRIICIVLLISMVLPSFSLMQTSVLYAAREKENVVNDGGGARRWW